jgi:hypothetical protein
VYREERREKREERREKREERRESIRSGWRLGKWGDFKKFSTLYFLKVFCREYAPLRTTNKKDTC